MSHTHGEWLDRIRGCKRKEKSMDERTCETCRYNNRTWDMKPCDSCTIGGDGNKWEPKVKVESSYTAIKKYKVIYGRGEEHGISR